MESFRKIYYLPLAKIPLETAVWILSFVFELFMLTVLFLNPFFPKLKQYTKIVAIFTKLNKRMLLKQAK